MRRRRDVPADPVHSTGETVDAINSLLAGALPAVARSEITAATDALREFAAFLVPGEHLTREPITLVAGSLACDIHTKHGEDAVGVENPVPPPGAAQEAEWTLYVPVPVGAPFAGKDVEGANPHFRAGAAPADAGAAAKAAVGLADLVDADALRATGGRD